MVAVAATSQIVIQRWQTAHHENQVWDINEKI
jgi:hypothetical protein